MIPKKSSVVDCSNHIPSNSYLTQLNEHFQKERIPLLEVTFTRYGEDHQPTFAGQTKFQNCIFTAEAATKKEAERKIKSYIWQSQFLENKKASSSFIRDSGPMMSGAKGGDDPDVIDCSNHEVSLDNLARLNEYLQVNRLPGLSCEFLQEGKDNVPFFTCETEYENKTYRAVATTKKESEKKVKSYLWEVISGRRGAQARKPQFIPNKFAEAMSNKYAEAMPNRYSDFMPNKYPEVNLNRYAEPVPERKVEEMPNQSLLRSKLQAKFGQKKEKICEPYHNFRKVLVKPQAYGKPVLIIDLTTANIDEIRNPGIQDYCMKVFSRIITFGYLEASLGWDSVIEFWIQKDPNKILLQECLKRLLYHVMDDNLEPGVVLLTETKFSTLIPLAKKTDQKLFIIANISPPEK